MPKSWQHLEAGEDLSGFNQLRWEVIVLIKMRNREQPMMSE